MKYHRTTALQMQIKLVLKEGRELEFKLPWGSEFPVDFYYFSYTDSPRPHSQELAELPHSLRELMYIQVRKSCLALAKHPVLGIPHDIPLRMMVSENKTKRFLLSAWVQSHRSAPFKLIEAAICCLLPCRWERREVGGVGSSCWNNYRMRLKHDHIEKHCLSSKLGAHPGWGISSKALTGLQAVKLQDCPATLLFDSSPYSQLLSTHKLLCWEHGCGTATENSQGNKLHAGLVHFLIPLPHILWSSKSYFIKLRIILLF